MDTDFQPGSDELPQHIRSLLDSWHSFMEGRVEALLDRLDAWPEAKEQVYERWVHEIESDPHAIQLLEALFPADVGRAA